MVYGPLHIPCHARSNYYYYTYPQGLIQKSKCLAHRMNLDVPRDSKSRRVVQLIQMMTTPAYNTHAMITVAMENKIVKTVVHAYRKCYQKATKHAEIAHI